MLNNRTLLVSRKWPRRGNYTSVEHFLDYFPEYDKLLIAAEEVRFYRLFKWIAKTVPIQNYTSFSCYIEFRALLKYIQKKPNHIHYMYGDHDCYFLARLSNLLNIRVSATYYFSPKELKEKYSTYKHLSYLFCLFSTGSEQKKIFQSLEHPPNKIFFLPLGIDTVFFSPDLDQKSSAFHILQSGKNRRDFTLLKSLLIPFLHKHPEAIVSLIGRDPIKELFQDLPRCTVYGQLGDEEYRSFYQQAHVMILPLEDGATSNSHMEALACGLPVIASDFPNFSCIGEKGIYLCKQPFLSTMLQQLEFCYQNPEDLASKSREARTYALQFDWKNIKSQMMLNWSES